MPVVLIAHGPNSVKVPCRLFEDMEGGEESCDKIFEDCEHDKAINGGEVIYDIREVVLNDVVSDKLFDSHYYGCGEAYRFTLKEVQWDSKFVNWNLD